MDIFNVINNRLIEKGFKSMDSLEIEELGAVIYSSSINHVVLKKIHTFEEIGEIKSFSSKIRSIQLDRKVNISNTYLLFCITKNIDYETFFMIERDTKALRKYVIRNKMDLNRIPFLDDLMIIAYELSHLCGVLSHSVRTIEPVNADVRATLLIKSPSV